MFEKLMIKFFIVLLGVNRQFAYRLSWQAERQYSWLALQKIGRDIQDRIRVEDEQRAWDEYHARLVAEAEEADSWNYEDDNHPHDQAETDAAWEQHYEQLDREAEDAMLNQVCPCGHPGHKHEGTYCDGHCTVPGCDCPQFGEPPENYETYTRVWFTEAPGGHNGWE